MSPSSWLLYIIKRRASIFGRWYFRNRLTTKRLLKTSLLITPDKWLQTTYAFRARWSGELAFSNGSQLRRSLTLSLRYTKSLRTKTLYLSFSRWRKRTTNLFSFKLGHCMSALLNNDRQRTRKKRDATGYMVGISRRYPLFSLLLSS